MAREDKETLVEKWLRRAKNNPIVAGLILFGLAIGTIAVFITQVDEARRVFWPPESAPVAEPSSPPEDKAAPKPEVEDKPKPDPPAAAPSTPAKDDERVFAHCIDGVMPSVVPPEGRFYIVKPREQPEWIGNVFTEYFGVPGSQWKFTNSTGGPAWGYRCELTNHSPEVLFNLTLPIGLAFRESLPVPGQEKSRRRGAITLARNWTVNIPKLDPSPAAPFVFYIWNKGVQRFVFLSLPKAVEVEGGRKVPLVQSKNNLYEPLNPDPFN